VVKSSQEQLHLKIIEAHYNAIRAYRADMELRVARICVEIGLPQSAGVPLARGVASQLEQFLNMMSVEHAEGIVSRAL